AVATESLKVELDENLAENAEDLGKRFREAMNEYIASSTIVKLIRGKGLIYAIVINDSPNSDIAWNICLKLRDNGLLVKQTHDNIIRCALQLVMTQSQLDDCMNIIIKTLKECEK